jgi:glycosyltransferase A (GT-A) superfamily protein (DUF2064 family)
LTSALIIFTKVPQKGKVKTRLSDFLNPDQIESLQIAMLKDCIESGLKAEYDKIIFSIFPAESEKEFNEKIDLKNNFDYEFKFIDQEGDSFDKRFDSAVKKSFEIPSINRIAIIGSDCPFISPEIHGSILNHLEIPSNVVFGWSRDGGVYTVGLSKQFGINFNFVNKFSENVESWLLIEEAKKLNLTVKNTPELSDIDTPDDLRHAFILCNNLEKSGLFYPKYTNQAFNDIGLFIEHKENNREHFLSIKNEN